MNYCALLTPHHLAMVHDWLANSKSVFLRIERPHSGASGESHTIRSLNDLRTLLAGESHPEIDVFIFQMPPVSDDELDRMLESDWVYRNADRVLYVSVRKNRNRYEPYEQVPARYERIVQEWRATA